MANSAAGVTFTEKNYAYYLESILKKFRACVCIIAERGPINDPVLVSDVGQYERIFGRLLEADEDPFLIRRALERKTPLYINRVEHYSGGSLTATKSYSNLNDRGSAFATKTLGSTVKIKYTSRLEGTAGNSITVEQKSTSADQDLSISVSDTAIVIELATDESGAPTSTAAQVAAAVNAHVLASALVYAEVVVAGVAEDVAETALTGGATGTLTAKISAKNEGAWSASGNLQFLITTSAADSARFNLALDFDLQPEMNTIENYKDLSMDPTDSRYAPTYINARSNLITFTDERANKVAGATYCPRNSSGGIYESFATSGTGDGSTVVDADYIGDSGDKTGFYAFDSVDDAARLAVPANSSHDVLVAGAAYCENRADMIFIHSIPNLAASAALDWRKREGDYSGDTAVASSYAALFYGHLDVNHPTKGRITIPPTADVLAVHAFSKQEAEHLAPAGLRRGKITNVLSIYENLGSAGRKAELDEFAIHQINPIAAFAGEPACVWDQQTMDSFSSPMQNIHARDIMIMLRKALMKVNRIDLFQPHLPKTWRMVYSRIDDFMRGLKYPNGDAFEDYAIQCDQFASVPEDAVLNTVEHRERGEFVCRIFVKITPAIRTIGIEAIITKLSANFAELFNVPEL